MERLLKPASRDLVSAFVNLNREGCQTHAFRNALRKELAGYGWEPEEIAQALQEIGDIARENLL